MHNVDVAIVGAGLAGASAAVLLARQGIDAVLIDPRDRYPADFRCEKLDPVQMELVEKAGLADIIQPATTDAGQLWIARLGRLLDRKPNGQLGFRYEDVVNALRGASRDTVPLLTAKAEAIEAGDDRQIVRLSGGETVSARLVILASGLNLRVSRTLGLQRETLSACHSLSIGFDMRPAGGGDFAFRALTYFPESVASQMAYLTLFPVGDTTRANLFVYRDLADPWVARFRAAPLEAMAEIMPRLGAITGDFVIDGATSIRPVDLYRTTGHVRGGVVLVGDAFATSCPAAGTGANKVFTDVERLCDVYVPDWLASPGMGADKIARFYADPDKVACDEDSLSKAYMLKTLSLDAGMSWQARRWIWFAAHLGVGVARRATGRH